MAHPAVMLMLAVAENNPGIIPSKLAVTINSTIPPMTGKCSLA
jgi:hypothetical protein